MTNEIAPLDGADVMDRVIAQGDLARLSPADRVRYYMRTCESLGLNPLTKPFEYIELDGKLTLYATRTTTDQLRMIHRVALTIVARDTLHDVYIVTVRATMPDGRTDESTGAVPLVRERGEWRTSNSGKRYYAGDGTYEDLPPKERANAYMKAETKAKRRATLSICGLGWVDESEIDSIPSARRVNVNDSDSATVAAVVDDDSERAALIERLKALFAIERECIGEPPAFKLRIQDEYERQCMKLSFQIENSRSRIAQFLGLPSDEEIDMSDDELRDGAIAQAARVAMQADEVPADL